MVAATLPSTDFAIRLADEGVPLRAIARAVGLPSESVRAELARAKSEGKLVELPCEDWPTGFPRDQRALQLSRMAHENKDAVNRAVRDIFRLTGVETRLLLALVQTPMMARSRGSMNDNTVYVHVHRLRKKLKPFNIKVEILREYGYQIPARSRRLIVDLILGHIV